MRNSLGKFILLMCFPFLLMGQNQQKELLAYNLSFGGIVGGVGAVINKSKEQKWKAAFVKGFWQGCIGGGLQFYGKKTVYLVNKHGSLVYAWPAKLIHDAGTSIIANAGENKPFLQNWNINIGPARFDFSFTSPVKTKARFLPISIYSIILGFNKGRPDFFASICTGNLVFVNNGDVINVFGMRSSGGSFGRAIVYINDYDKYHYISHEMLHQFQFDEYQSFNAWLRPIIQKTKLETGKNILSKYVYLDIPYFWPAYGIEGRSRHLSTYYRNFYELEAESFSTNRFVRTR